MKEINDFIAAAEAGGGKVETPPTVLPDGSGFFTMSFPLPKDHWLYEEKNNVPPMPLRLGFKHPQYEELRTKMREAAKYAIRCSTLNGKDEDFDPDAMVQNFLVGVFGYNSPDGLTTDPADRSWCDPHPTPPLVERVVYKD